MHSGGALARGRRLGHSGDLARYPDGRGETRGTQRHVNEEKTRSQKRREKESIRRMDDAEKAHRHAIKAEYYREETRRYVEKANVAAARAREADAKADRHEAKARAAQIRAVTKKARGGHAIN